MACLLKARTVEHEKKSAAKERLCKHIHCQATGTTHRSRDNEETHNRGTTRTMFSTRSIPKAFERTPEWAATLTWWEGLCLFGVKKADQRQSEIK
jgi:hypothetical protein